MNPLVVTTSWDDGVAHDLRLADLLAKYGLTGTFYVPVSAPKRTLIDEDVRQLAGRFEIGSHSKTHSRLSGQAAPAVEREIMEGRRYLEDLLGKEVTTFAYPYGDFDAATVSAVQRCGVTLARTTAAFALAPPTNWLQCGTTLQATPHSHLVTDRLLDAYPDADLVHDIRLIRNASGSGTHYRWLDLAATSFAAALARGGIWHLWGHSWEIEEHHMWADLDAIFTLIAASGATCVTNGQLESAVRAWN